MLRTVEKSYIGILRSGENGENGENARKSLIYNDFFFPIFFPHGLPLVMGKITSC